MDVTAAGYRPRSSALKADNRASSAVPWRCRTSEALARSARPASSPRPRSIGAVNAIYRENGELVGANTDGAARCRRSRELVGGGHALQTRRALVLRPRRCRALGGRLPGRPGDRADRRQPHPGHRADAVAARLGAWSPTGRWAPTCSARSTCWSMPPASATGTGRPARRLRGATWRCCRRSAAVYDAIYQPDVTRCSPLARRARASQTRNGLGMNLDQAVIAFGKAVPGAARQGTPCVRRCGALTGPRQRTANHAPHPAYGRRARTDRGSRRRDHRRAAARAGRPLSRRQLPPTISASRRCWPPVCGRRSCAPTSTPSTGCAGCRYRATCCFKPSAVARLDLLRRGRRTPRGGPAPSPRERDPQRGRPWAGVHGGTGLRCRPRC